MEDAAGILFKRGVARMFALCKRYVPVDAIEILPAGKYLCADCAAQDRDGTMERLLHMAKTQWGAQPEFCVAGARFRRCSGNTRCKYIGP